MNNNSKNTKCRPAAGIAGPILSVLPGGHRTRPWLKTCRGLIPLFSGGLALTAGAEPSPDEAKRWSLTPSFTLSTLYDSNIFATDSDPEADLIAMLEPQLDVATENPAGALSFTVGAQLGRYSQFSQENFDDYWGQVDWRRRWGEGSQVFGGLAYSAEHEPRDSPDADLSGDAPTTLAALSAHLGLSTRRQNDRLRIGLTYERLDYDDVPRNGGILINSDRDRELRGIGLRAGRQGTPTTEWFLQAEWGQRDYRRAVDIDGYRRDSDGHAVALGARYRPSADRSAEVYLGYLSQDYEDPRFAEFRAPDFALQVNWQFLPQLDLLFELDRDLQETTQSGSAGYLLTEGYLNLHYQWSPRLAVYLDTSLGHTDYLDVSRADDLFGLGVGVEYAVSRDFHLTLDAGWNRRDSNDRISPGHTLNGSDDFERYSLAATLRVALPQ